ncbi:UNVERIFIED_CONTAM: hypothetical protein Sradi_0547900 [Sesamum radiatum]|uniref:MULE transposase domain-containing protein n=1 Tax=Sesamum radiatum TaxID=300843 RepID=A0AAW2VHF3_SESRA
MSTSSSRIDILVYFGGELSEDGWSVTYDRRPIAVMRIPRSSTYAQFLARIYQKIGADSNEYLLKVSAKYSCTYLGHIKETVVEIKDDDTLSFFLDPAAEIPSMEVLDVGMLFKNKEALIEAVKDHSARHARREYYVTESSKTKWKVLCKHSTPGQVKCNPTFAIKHVIQTVKDHTGYDIPYQKAWYSLKMAREIVYGTWESSVQKLPKYMGAVQKYNPGTIVEWKHKALHPTGAYVIGYVFWAFKPCIEGFKFCRNIISVDGTHLYTRYKHKMLIAATMDGNQQVLPLAFAIVDDESYASWKWFLQQLSRHVIRGRRGVCLISDRHAGIIKAVNESSEFVPPNGVHRYCLRHVCSNFNSHHKNIVLKDLCWRAGSEYQIRKFNRIMEEIKGQKLEAFTFLDRINKEKWTASHDGGWRCGILTTNMSECINGVLKGARRLPVTAIVEITLQRTAHYFRERALRSAVMLSNGQLWTDFAKKKFTDWGEKSITHTVTKYDHLQQSASVVTKRQQGLGFNTHVVKLAKPGMFMRQMESICLKNIGMFRILSWYTTLLFVPLHVLVEAKHHVFRTRWIGDKREQDNKPNEEENLQDNQM